MIASVTIAAAVGIAVSGILSVVQRSKNSYRRKVVSLLVRGIPSAYTPFSTMIFLSRRSGKLTARAQLLLRSLNVFFLRRL